MRKSLFALWCEANSKAPEIGLTMFAYFIHMITSHPACLEGPSGPAHTPQQLNRTAHIWSGSTHDVIGVPDSELYSLDTFGRCHAERKSIQVAEVRHAASEAGDTPLSRNQI